MLADCVSAFVNAVNIVNVVFRKPGSLFQVRPLGDIFLAVRAFTSFCDIHDIHDIHGLSC